jgi:predicted unusual protein kinase regulating ubiquinone biosynthesis (AarF/ABC1/UbiB family)
MNALSKINQYKVQKVSKIMKYGIELELIRTFKKVDNRYIGKWMKEKLVTLGPTFIKIGQFMSTRQDIFGKEFTDELKQLQDNVDPFSFKELEIELEDIKDQFQYINEIPLAAASIGQVHRAKLKTGEEVVIKARRPGIIQNIKDDFELVLLLLDSGKKIINTRRIQEINVLFEEYYKLLVDEIDFIKEKKNMKAFTKMFADTPWILVPDVYENLSNSNIITMEYIPSIKIDDEEKLNSMKLNKRLIADKLMESYIKQIIEYGLVHIDLHQGNIGMTKNGKIVLYDYGMILKLDKKIKENFNSLLLAIYEKDVNEICDVAIELDLVIIEESDIPSFKSFIYYFLNYLDTLDVNNFKISYLDKIDQSNLNFMLSSKFLMLIRGITILEGICKELDNGFSYMRTLEPYINNMVMFDISYLEKKAQKDIKKLINSRDDNNEIQVEMMRSSMKKMESKMYSNNELSRNAIAGIISFVILLFQYIK